MANDNKPPEETVQPNGGKEKAKKPTIFRTEMLIQSKRFEQYHADFLRALLPKEQYTMAEAEAIVKAYFEKDTEKGGK